MVKDRLEEIKRVNIVIWEVFVKYKWVQLALFFQLCQVPQNNIRETVVDIKANKIEMQIDDILTEVSNSKLISFPS